MKFDDIDLSNDKSAPKLDLDFGLPASAASDKKSGGFSFGGGWGGGWGSGNGGAAAPTTSSWGFGATEEKKEEAPKVDDSWGFGSGKKDKNKKDGFDFDFDTLGAGDDLGLPAKKEEPEDDPW